MAPTKKNAKATKKFEQKHLKGVLERRKATAKIKQRQLVQAKKKAKRAQDDDFYKGPKGADGDAAPRRTPAARAGAASKASEMSVDDFFRGGFEILDGGSAPAEKKGATAATTTTPTTPTTANGKLGKRKREGAGGVREADEVSSEGSDVALSDMEDMEQPVASDDDDDGDDDDDEEEDPGMSKAAMEALAKDDPEFYHFLKENDPGALDFDENVDLAEIDELSGSDEEKHDGDGDGDADRQPKKKKQKKDAAKQSKSARGTELTQETIAKWKTSMAETHSLRAAREVVLAFRAAAHLNDAEGDDAAAAAKRPPHQHQRYTIASPEVFHDILVAALRQVPEVLQHHVPVRESASGRVHLSTETTKFKTLSILTKSFTASILHLLGTLSDDATLKLTLSSLTPLLPYLLSFRKLLKAVVKAVVAFWSQPASSETIRLTAFLVLRRLVAVGDKGVREAVLRATYHGLLQGARVTNPATLRGLHLMKNSAAELWGLDPAVGYTTAFAALRQLAIHLRNSIVHNQNDAYRRVYNWSYLHALDFWSCVLAEHCSPLREAEAGRGGGGGGGGGENPLRLLVYPLVQVTLGAARLVPTALYFPLRFHLVRSLLRLSRATGVYIPLAPLLLEVLASAALRKPARPSTLKPLDFAVAYKCPKAYLHTRAYQDGVGEQVVELLGEFYALWATSIAFPESALPTIVAIKRWLKETRSPPPAAAAAAGGAGTRKGGKKKKGGKKTTPKGNRNGKLASALAVLVQKLEANARFVEERRARVDFAPKDRAQVEAFLKDFEWEKTPLGAYVVAQRKLRAERQKLMEEARREEDKKRREEEREKLQGSDAGDSGEDSGGEEEEEEEEEEESEDEAELEMEDEDEEESGEEDEGDEEDEDEDEEESD